MQPFDKYHYTRKKLGNVDQVVLNFIYSDKPNVFYTQPHDKRYEPVNEAEYRTDDFLLVVVPACSLR